MAAACVVMAVAGTFEVLIGAAVLLGINWGVFMAVDQALVNEVLPVPEARGRDVGVMNLAVLVPNALAPVIAALALHHLGGYAGLYLLSAGPTVLGGLLLGRIRSVR
ncbi:hypothetical protein CGZ93_00425 [Enemella dayhoffiae]|uniref:Major facilitator superfamily (MFS) profile domain-containing protein n=1 Tax=Enemella dayhoffiae TaxID=2016507 RepID=A0A255HCN6_9ACTN|nr:hypothetical protein CGZ93_00425 [Enemella dayhoffiae]